jgi:hypothetical protein
MPKRPGCALLLSFGSAWLLTPKSHGQGRAVTILESRCDHPVTASFTLAAAKRLCGSIPPVSEELPNLPLAPPYLALRALLRCKEKPQHCDRGELGCRRAGLGLGVVRLPVRQTLREFRGRRQEGRHLLFDQLLLLHRGGKHDLVELVSPCLPMRLYIVVFVADLFRRVVQRCRSCRINPARLFRRRRLI